MAVTLITLTLAAATGGAAADAGENAQPLGHVRTIDSRPSALIAEGARRSPMFRKLVTRLNRSTVIVYIEYRLLPEGLSGRLTVIGGGQVWRYLRIEIECRQSTDNQIAALGHELQHAVEIADAGAAADEASIRALYGTIGFAIDNSQRRFESAAAKHAGSRIRQELSLRLPTSLNDLR
jgi:hypothetical protein